MARHLGRLTDTARPKLGVLVFGLALSLPAGWWLVNSVQAAKQTVLNQADNSSNTSVTDTGPAAPPTPAYTLSLTITADSVTTGETVTLTARVASAVDSNVLVDLEVADQSGNKVGQQFWDNQSLAAGETQTYPWAWQVPVTTPPGTYLAKMAIFTPGWGSFLGYFEAQDALNIAATCSNTLQSLVDAAPPGSVLSVPPCVYRETVTVNRPVTLEGNGQATITGSDVWTDWTTAASNLYRSSKAVPGFAAHGECATSDKRCLHPEQVYFDNKPLRLVLAGSPTSGQFALDSGRHVLLADNPSGHTVEVTTRTAWIVGAAAGVTIDGFTMRHAANDAQTGALSNGRRANWTVQNNQLSFAHGWVVDLSGNTGLQASNNDISFGGQLGLGSAQASGLALRGNKFHDNNTDGFDPFWEAGGVKMASQNGVTVDGNEFAANAGPGLWADLNCRAVTFSNNRVHDNERMGILFEISNQAKIFGNRVWDNGAVGAEWGWGAGIVISSSANTDVYQNVVAWNSGGISVISQNRNVGIYTSNNFVHDNTVIGNKDAHNTNELNYAIEWLQDWYGPLFDPAANNRGANNAYWFPSSEDSQVRFAWNGPISHLDVFNKTPGGSGGTYLTDEQKDAALNAEGMPTLPVARR